MDLNSVMVTWCWLYLLDVGDGVSILVENFLNLLLIHFVSNSLETFYIQPNGTSRHSQMNIKLWRIWEQEIWNLTPVWQMSFLSIFNNPRLTRLSDGSKTILTQNLLSWLIDNWVSSTQALYVKGFTIFETFKKIDAPTNLSPILFVFSIRHQHRWRW